MAAYRSVYATVIRRQMAGVPVEKIAAEQWGLLQHTYDVLSRVL